MTKVATLNFFVALPGRVLADDELTALDFRVLGVVAAHDRMGRNGQCCWAGQKKLSAMVGCDPTRLSASLSKLVRKEYLQELRDENDKRRKGFRVVYIAEKDAASIGASNKANSLPNGNATSGNGLRKSHSRQPDTLPKQHLTASVDEKKGKVDQLVKNSVRNPNIFRETEDITRKQGFGTAAKPPDRVLAELLGGGDCAAGWKMLANLPEDELWKLRRRYGDGTIEPGDLMQARELVQKVLRHG